MGGELLWVSSSFDYTSHELQFLGFAHVHGARALHAPTKTLDNTAYAD